MCLPQAGSKETGTSRTRLSSLLLEFRHNAVVASRFPGVQVALRILSAATIHTVPRISLTLFLIFTKCLYDMGILFPF